MNEHFEEMLRRLKLTKNQKAALAKYDRSKVYSLSEACEILKEVTYTKFDASVEVLRHKIHW